MNGWQNGMKQDEIILINLYISLRIAQAKRELFEQKGCGVPEGLTRRIFDLEAAIAECEGKVPV